MVLFNAKQRCYLGMLIINTEQMHFCWTHTVCELHCWQLPNPNMCINSLELSLNMSLILRNFRVIYYHTLEWNVSDGQRRKQRQTYNYQLNNLPCPTAPVWNLSITAIPLRLISTFLGCRPSTSTIRSRHPLGV